MTAILAGCSRMGGRRPPRPFRRLDRFRMRGARPAPKGDGPAPGCARRAVTRTASTQTYLTIRFLVEPQRRDAAFCAYAYFRWVDDVLDAHEDEPPETTRSARISFLERQKALVESCLQGETPAGVNGHEALLIDLLHSAAATKDALRTYVELMMRVMEFDARRRGRVVSAADLDQYTSWLATAITEAMHTFLGGATYQPHDEARYSAVTGAHILHMLRHLRRPPRRILQHPSRGPRCERDWAD